VPCSEPEKIAQGIIQTEATMQRFFNKLKRYTDFCICYRQIGWLKTLEL